MVVLSLGVALWCVAHLFAVIEPPPRAAAIAKLGEGPYRGLFSLVILVSIGLMIIGWRAATPTVLYSPPAGSFYLSLAVMFAAVVLFVTSVVGSNLRRVVRHPQLTGLATWAVAHLVSNGDTRSLVLFGGLGAWAVLSIVLINRRDGDWRKPAPRPASGELLPLVISAGVFVALYAAHPIFAGIALPVAW